MMILSPGVQAAVEPNIAHCTNIRPPRSIIKMLAPATPTTLARLALIVAAARTVSAHGFIDRWLIDGRNYTGFNPTSAPWQPDQGTIAWPAWNENTGPVFSTAAGLSSPNIICQINATNAQTSAAVPAGSTLQLHWTPWIDSHHGPIMTYLAACPGAGAGDCSTADKTKLAWFKIAELGQISLGAGYTPGVWASDQMRAAGGTWSVTIPASLRAGRYVLRNEIIALHNAYQVGGAQFYPQCANIEITGGGTLTPPGVLGTQLYNATDPGVLYNIYNDGAKPVYKIPGPPLCTYSQKFPRLMILV